jgi:hypothetical protein
MQKGNVVPILDRLETGALFRLTRFVAFSVVLLLTSALLVGAFVFFNDFFPKDSSHVSYGRIHQELEPERAPSSAQIAGQQPVPNSESDDLQLPLPLQPYFADSTNRKVLKDHLQSFDTSERSEYVDNLSEVIESAKREGADNDRIIAIINRYFEDKADQMSLARLDKESRRQRQLYLIGGTASVIAAIAVASLVLVLLAIERNTRSLRQGTD